MLLVLLLLSCKCSLFILDTGPLQIYHLQIHCPILWVELMLPQWCFLKHNSFQFCCSPIYLLFNFVACAFNVIPKKPSTQQQQKHETTQFKRKRSKFLSSHISKEDRLIPG